MASPAQALIRTTRPLSSMSKLSTLTRHGKSATSAVILLFTLGGNGAACAQGMDKPFPGAGPTASTSLTIPDPAFEQEISRLKWEVNGSPRGSASAADAAWLLGLIYLHGAGTRADLPQAFDWFARSLDLGGQGWAHAGLAWCHIEACNGEKNLEAASGHITELRHTHPGRADYLAWLLSTRHGTAFRSSDTASSRQLLRRAARSGDVQAEIELGLRAATSNNLPKASGYVRQDAPHAASAQADIRIVQQPDSTRQGRYPDANSPAEDIYRAARANHRGDGRPRNFTEAIRLYRLASAKGNLPARRMLELIYSRPNSAGGVDIGWMSQLANVNLAPASPFIDGSPAPDARRLQRDPTPLFDLLPPQWQKRVPLAGP